MTGEGGSALRDLADQCRRLARGASTGAARNCLNEMAEGYERRAVRADASESENAKPVDPGTKS